LSRVPIVVISILRVEASRSDGSRLDGTSARGTLVSWAAVGIWPPELGVGRRLLHVGGSTSANHLARLNNTTHLARLVGFDYTLDHHHWVAVLILHVEPVGVLARLEANATIRVVLGLLCGADLASRGTCLELICGVIRGLNGVLRVVEYVFALV